MRLSDLIHKNKSAQLATLTVATLATQETETPPTVAKVASVTVANLPELNLSTFIVTCFTPNGKPIKVEARDTQHAEWLKQMNPRRGESK